MIIVTHAIEEASALGRRILLLGSAPNRTARVFENPQAGQPDYRNSPSYHDLCNLLWKEMQHEAA